MQESVAVQATCRQLSAVRIDRQRAVEADVLARLQRREPHSIVVSARTGEGVEQLLARRLSRVPLQHLLGSTGFRRIEVEVGPGVFIPRPETELVTEAGIRELAAQPAGPPMARPMAETCSTPRRASWR